MARQPAEISQQSCFRIDPVPDLHLTDDLRLQLRAYILKCADDCWYGGLAPAPKIRERIQEQFEADMEKGFSHYCATHPPELVACVWPVALHAVEAAFFNAMQESLGVTDTRRLGGCVYTSSKPSPLDVMRLAQTPRQLRNKCFDCWQGHYAKHRTCPGSNLDCWYKCVGCSARNNASSRGRSTSQGLATQPAQQSAAKAAPPPPRTVVPAAKAKTSGVTAASRKRCVGSAFSHTVAPLSFEQCWGSDKVRKKGRWRSVKDMLKVVDAIQAGRAVPTISERLRKMSINKGWLDDAFDYFTELKNPRGGGTDGVGCTKRSMTQFCLTIMSWSETR